MQPLRAQVKNGRLVLDDSSTDLPEGAVVELCVVEHGGLDPEDNERLQDSLRESIDQMKAGELIDAEEALALLRAHR